MPSLTMPPAAPRDLIARPAEHAAWIEQQAWPILVVATALIVAIHPTFHFVLGLLPAPPPDSLALRAGVAALALSLTGLAWVWPAARRHAAALQTVSASALMASTGMLVVDSGNAPMYVSAGLVAVFAFQLAFVRRVDLLTASAVGVAWHLVYAALRGRLADWSDAVALLTLMNAYAITIAMGWLRISLLERELAARLDIEQKSRELSRAYSDLAQAREQSEALLRNILPAPIAARLIAGQKVIADRFDGASVLFADLVDFTTLAGSRGPEDLVHVLNELFSRFDRVAAELGVEKIKTIGDAWMAAAGVPTPRADHAAVMAELGLRLVDEVRRYREETGLPIHIRVGLNAGPVVAGVIGEHKFIYDLWGDSVNMASRMESHGLPDAVHCTAAFAEAVAGSFVVEPRGLVDVKGKGPTSTWWVAGRRG